MGSLSVGELVSKLGLDIVAGQGGLSRRVQGVYIGDLLSCVMANIKSGDIWITIQTHINIVAVALLGEASCIIVVESNDIDNATIQKANEENIPLLKSTLSAFELAIKIDRTVDLYEHSH